MIYRKGIDRFLPPSASPLRGDTVAPSNVSCGPPRGLRLPYRPAAPRQGQALRVALRSVALRSAPALTWPPAWAVTGTRAQRG